jgi:hypothetical protein
MRVVEMVMALSPSVGPPPTSIERLSKGNLSRIERERYVEDLGMIIVDAEELEKGDTDVEEDSDDEFESYEWATGTL